MNTLMLVVLAVVLLCYCGGRFCPKVLKENKEVVLGVLVGMALCSFAGLRMEGIYVGIGKENCDQSRMTRGITDPCTDTCECQGSMTCNNGRCGAKTTQPTSDDESRLSRFNAEVDDLCNDPSNQGTAMYQMFCRGR